ncbi:hypothetical protein niasHS_005038 [Heterodera schachtii]|uniref:Helitron helicase-like domain-containing protein n=1 Tax=Heterodera schachtii TaxID=97005 RepID=A0ABD2JKJ2_HETSC
MADLIQAQTEQGRIDSLSSDTQSESEAILGQEKDDAQQNVDLTKLGASSSSIIDIRQEEPETAVLCDLEQYNLTNIPTTTMTKSRKLDQPFSASMAPLTQARNEQGRIDSLSIGILSQGDGISDIANQDAQQNDDLGPSVGGRPQKKTRGPGRKALTNDHGSGVTPLFADCPSGRGDGGVNSRRIVLRSKHICQIEERLYKVLSDYSQRPWPLKNQVLAKRNWIRCKGDCDCKSAAQCQQNAQAYIASAKYDREFTPKKTMPLKLTKMAKQCHHKHACASSGANHRVDYYDSGQFGDANCKHCGAVLLESEANAINKQGRVSPCCSSGQCHTEQMKAEFDELQNPPQLLKDLVAAPDERIRFEFLDNTMPLNNTFAFASVHSEKAPAEQMAGRMDTVKYNGEFSFMLSDLISPQGRRPTFAQVYTLMPEDALKLRTENITQALSKNIRNEILAKLELLMRENPLGQTFVTAGAKIEEAAKQNYGILPHFQIVLLTNRDLKVDALRTRTDCTIIERADAPTAQQVAVIWVQEDGLAPEVNGFWICDKAGKMRELKSGMPQLDPCCFPLLHPRGTFGWRWFMKKTGAQGRPTVPMPSHSNMQTGEEGQQNIDDSVTEFDNDDICDNEQRREFESDPIFSATDSVIEPAYETFPRKRQLGIKKVGPQENISERQFYRYRLAIRENSRGAFHWLWFSRRLAEYFVIAVLNRIERNEMDHVKAIQQKKNYRQTLARDYIKAIEQGLQQQGRNAKLGSVFMMPHTFAGSRQYYQQKYADLMTVVRHLGNPTWFVTFTGNPSWPELKEALQGRQQYTHRADIVCRIFMDKASEFVRDLIEKNVLGKVAGWCYSVEHQKRGMPHIHILLILEEQGRLTTPEMVDQFVCARIPPLPPMEDLSPEANQQRRLWHYVTTMMLHDCNAACIELNGQGRPSCRKHFPKPYSELTELSEVRYTNYVRLPADMVDGTFHAGASTIHPTAVPNHEGHLLPADDPERFEKAFVKVVQPRRADGTANEQIYDYDEISATFKVRYMTSMEAYLRLHSYKIVSLSHQIYQLSIHDELGQTIVVEEGHEEQGRKNIEAHTRLTAFFALCTTDPNASELTYSRVPYFYFWNQKKRYWQKRTRPLYEGERARMFVRVYTVSPKRHELFAIRALLLNRKGPKSFVDLRTIDGQVLGTFTEAAIQLRLLENDYIFAGAMRDACTDKMDLNKLQHYFALLIVHGRPSNPQKLFEDFIDHMRPHRSGVDDDDQARSLETRRGEVMRNLEYYFNCMDTSCSYTVVLSFLQPALELLHFYSLVVVLFIDNSMYQMKLTTIQPRE